MKTIRLLRPLICFSLISILFLTCNHSKKNDLEVEKQQILELHNVQRNYHFKKDSIAFANQLSDNFISVNKGKINAPKRRATVSRYHGYFSSVEFLKWDDVSEPIIKFSDDRTLAYTIVDKIVAVTTTDENGNILIDSTHFAWTAIYKKYGNQWKIDCVTSTNKPIVE